jgi:hypothetical protein
MKDHLIALLEAVRLARLELECHRDPQCRAREEWTIARLSALLESADVNRAMKALVPDEGSPSIVPEVRGTQVQPIKLMNH